MHQAMRQMKPPYEVPYYDARLIRTMTEGPSTYQSERC